MSSIMLGPQFGIEANITISTDLPIKTILGQPSGEGDNGYGFTFAPPEVGISLGVLGYADLSYTTEIRRGNIENVEAFASDFINLVIDQVGNINAEAEQYIRQQLEQLPDVLKRNIPE